MKSSLIEFWRENKIIHSEKLLEAFRKVPREKFILEDYKDQAYADIALPLTKGQTISQPTTVMLMTQALDVNSDNKVLEVGTGSGYQAAILSYLAKEIITTEIVPEMVSFAKKNLKSYKNVKIIKAKENELGYKKEAPYDRIIVTAASPEIPKVLLEQLKPRGIMVVPVGKYSQKMLVIKKDKELKINNLGEFMFVPLKGKFGFQ